jgi:hypothetical protein
MSYKTRTYNKDEPEVFFVDYADSLAHGPLCAEKIDDVKFVSPAQSIIVLSMDKRNSYLSWIAENGGRLVYKILMYDDHSWSPTLCISFDTDENRILHALTWK